MAWLDDKVMEWGKKEKARQGGEPKQYLHEFLNMTYQQVQKWIAEPPNFVAGSDEVGYGALAGPIVVCAILAAYDWSISGLADSKALTENQRYEMTCRLYAEQKAGRLVLHVVQVNAERIDELGVQTALRKCHDAALASVSSGRKNTMLVADGDLLLSGDVVSMPKADTFVPQVMAASIVAKHVRDGFMKDMATHFPGYGFEKHVGYGTKEHYASIEKLGPCSLHRKSYAPFREDKHERRDGAYNATLPETSGESSSGQSGINDVDSDIHSKRGAPHRARRKVGSQD